MLRWFKSMLLNRVYKNTIKSSTQSRKQSAPKVLRNISVILDSRLGIDKIHFKKLADVFNLPNKNVKVLTFYQSSNEIHDLSINSSYTQQDISNWGLLNGLLNDFCSINSDVLINFYEQDDINLKYVSAKTNRKISIGFNSVDHSLNDLIIEVDAQNIEVFLNECIKYLNVFFISKK